MVFRTKLLVLVLIVASGLLTASGCVRWEEKMVVFYVYAMVPFSAEGYVLPVFGAKVAVEGEVSLTIYTDTQGKAFTHMPPGTYRVEASKAGYTPVSRAITIYTIELGPAHYDFRLAPTGG